ncbi:hypothetical protein [Planctopirus hydrillae]|uniref:Uncharacterized protein n=1 Tax=Planctopirus hydrillae TaxID=1841610 RepID=A0A1C3EK88_9PLAN|nr:hypothetical protein [Planctopirus hydrillae]ODA33657.1 hypothetical protein A6X21_18175 [Planctopirus hydrillae]
MQLMKIHGHSGETYHMSSGWLVDDIPKRRFVASSSPECHGKSASESFPPERIKRILVELGCEQLLYVAE